LYCGWTVVLPDVSAYATTSTVPPVPAGDAVEFAVDYAAGTCRVAFYTPDAVAGGFVEPPHAKMELRFVATEAGAHPRAVGAHGGGFRRGTIPGGDDVYCRRQLARCLVTGAQIYLLRGFFFQRNKKKKLPSFLLLSE
jgi:hypothetical protein